VPVSWAELPKFDKASAFTMATIKARLSKLRADPWTGYAAAARQTLKQAALDAVSES
jgi:DNA primase